MRDEIYQKVLSKVVRYLSYRPRTRKELIDRLGRYLKSEDSLTQDEANVVTQRILDYLDQNKMFNDEEFARALIESKTKGKSIWGKRAIMAKLMEKGISKSDARSYLEKVVSQAEELNAANRALVRKFKVGVSDTPPPVASLKPKFFGSRNMREVMTKYLIGRGFSYDIALKAVDYLLKRP